MSKLATFEQRQEISRIAKLFGLSFTKALKDHLEGWPRRRLTQQRAEEVIQSLEHRLQRAIQRTQARQKIQNAAMDLENAAVLLQPTNPFRAQKVRDAALLLESLASH